MKMTRKQRTRNGKRRPTDRRAVPYPRPKVNFDGSVLHGTQFHPLSAVLVNAAGFVVDADCSNNSAGASSNWIQSLSFSLAGITANYAEYIYESWTIEWLPLIGPGQAGAGSRVYIAYTDNPEIISTLNGAAAITVRDAAKGSRNMRSFNAWEHFTYTVPLTRRRRMFDVNTNTSAVAIDTLDRSVQGAIYGGIDGINAAENLGTWRSRYTLRLKTLEYTAPAT